jgi:mycothiol synthase
MTTMTTLTTGYSVRRPTMDDIAAVYALEQACDLAEYGEQDVVEEDVRSYFQNQQLDEDTWLVSAADGRVIASAGVHANEYGRMFGNLRVHPAHRGRGIGTHLRHLLEARAHALVAHAPADVRVALNTSIYSKNAAARHFAAQAGYATVRHFWRMQIDLTAEPQAPVWPAGITLRTFARGRDERAVFEATDEAFSDHWGHVPSNYEEWENWTVKRGDFDPALWLLAVEGDQIAGVALDWLDLDPLRGWVGTLGVRRAYRRQGLGEALLYHSFGAFWRRGVHQVGLGVDAQSLTGATRLYERVGMRAVRHWDALELELRPGRDLAVRALDQ